MGALTRLSLPLLLVTALSCGEITGLEDRAVPLVRLSVRVEGEMPRPPEELGAPLRPRVALVWGKQWMPEPFCILPAMSSEAAAVIDAGCRDSFGFVPARLGADVSVESDGSATFELLDLPAADVMVGDLTARIAYASVVVYDDRDGNRALDLRRPPRVRDLDDEEHEDEEEEGGAGLAETLAADSDRVHGASFISMTRSDKRLAFREGGFSEVAAFYPRMGCPPPPEGFSVLGAGGFSASDVFSEKNLGALPSQDPESCSAEKTDEAVVVIEVPAAGDLDELACTVRRWGVSIGGSTRYYSPERAPKLDDRSWACVGLPRLGPKTDDKASETVQLVVSGLKSDACKSVSHFLLRGCDRDPDCERPEWDLSETPPEWWPCGDSQ
jgi:hypothetical protein